MKNFTFLLAVAFLCSASCTQERSIFSQIYSKRHRDPFPQHHARSTTVESLFMEQKLDHFNPNDTRTWPMHYFANSKFFEQGGPMFVFVGGEWTITPETISGGHVYDMAKAHHGYLFYTEHRFYGESKPLPDLSVKNLEYLNVGQALADLAYFIRNIKNTTSGLENSKVILIGGSYSATMVTWFKKLYPDLAIGCWASSAPLNAEVDFWQYKWLMGESMKLVNQETCLKRIGNGIKTLETMLDNKQAAEVKAMLKLCDNFDEINDLDQWTLFYEISDLFAELIQTHSDNEIQKACNGIMESETDVIGVVSYVLTHFNTTGCNDLTYKAFLSDIMETNYVDNKRQWTYQTCNEFGWFQTSSPDKSFGSKYPRDYFTNMCYDAFGTEFTPTTIERKVARINNKFGGRYINVKNVYMTHGELDPWRYMGITDEGKATVIPLHAHCKDFGSIRDSDSPELKASKVQIAKLVAKWLTE